MKPTDKRRIFALVRAGLAVVLAVILLAATGFAAADLLRGPVPVTEGAALQAGTYVQVDIRHIMSCFAVERDAKGSALAYYGAVPLGTRFVAVRFSQRQLADAALIESETEDFLTGARDTMSVHFIAAGRVRPMGDDLSPYFDQWFEENVPWMTAAGVIADIDDPALYLSDMIIEADRVGTVDYGWAVGLSVAAGVLLVYAVVELTLILAKVYDRPGKVKREEKTNA